MKGASLVPRSEQRAGPRYALEVPVRFTSDALGFECEAELVDFSEQGLFVRSDLLEAVGARVSLRLSLDEAEPVRLEGVVVWATERGPRGPGMGILLLGTPQGYLRRLVDLVAELRARGLLSESPTLH